MFETRWTDLYGGSTRLDLMVEGRSVSHIDGIVPYSLRFGNALVPVDGISGVGTEEDCRNRGYAAQIMNTAVSHMAQGNAVLSYLHGIRNFYHRFGYVPVCPGYELAVGTEANAAFTMPDGFRVRPAVVDDLPAIRALYDQNTQSIAGTAMRLAAGDVWNALPNALKKKECRVVVGLDGTVSGYTWLGSEFWAVREFAQGREENAFAVGEAFAADPRSAVALLAACRAWADEESVRRNTPIHQVQMPLPPVGPIAEALKFQYASVRQQYQPNGGLMARVIDVQRLLTALAPELQRRAQASGLELTLTLRTDIGEGSVTLTNDLTKTPGASIVVDLPQTSLVRLVFGTMSVEAVFDHDRIQVTDSAREALEVLFPVSCPHICLPDRC